MLWSFAYFFCLLAALPLYGALVARVRRRLFIPLVYHFFVANLAVFWLLLAFDVERQTVARVFFVWISVFVLFAVSVFWSFMADVYNSEQGKRLYGFIAAGGSAGALAGPALRSVAATGLYFEQAAILAAASDDPAVRTRIFAPVDLSVGVLTLLLQFV